MGLRVTLRLSSSGFSLARLCSARFFSSIRAACISANRLSSDSAVPSLLETVFFTRKSHSELLVSLSVRKLPTVSLLSDWLSKLEIL